VNEVHCCVLARDFTPKVSYAPGPQGAMGVAGSCVSSTSLYHFGYMGFGLGWVGLEAVGFPQGLLRFYCRYHNHKGGRSHSHVQDTMNRYDHDCFSVAYNNSVT
jgi:hypothetical protein